MAWMLLILFQNAVFTIVTDDLETCRAIQQVNHIYWHETGVKPQSLCVRTFEI